VGSKKGESKPVNVPLVIVLAVLPIVAGLIWYANKRAGEPSPTPAAVTAEAKAYVKNLGLAGVEMKATENFAGAAVVEITGRISNNGDRALSRVDLNCIFYDVNGLVVLRERVPIVRTTLKPRETKPFRLPFEGVSQNWNQVLPQLVIAQIVFE
jgi:hypothetical protein